MFYKSFILTATVLALSANSTLADDFNQEKSIELTDTLDLNLDYAKNVHLVDDKIIVSKEPTRYLTVEQFANRNFDDVFPAALFDLDLPNTVETTSDLMPTGVEASSSIDSVLLQRQQQNIQNLQASANSSLNDSLPMEMSGEKIAQMPQTPAPVEPKKWGVGIHTQASTAGFIGADVGYIFSPNLHARLGINAVGFNTNYNSQGIDYTASLNPTNIHLLGDYFPFGGGLRLTGGFVIQNNQVNATGKSATGATVTLGNNPVPYSSTDVGTLNGQGSFSSGIAPYLGLGFGTPISPGLGFNLDAGVMFAGSPTVKLSRSGGILSNTPIGAQIDADLATQERKTNDDIKNFNVYPVISIGLSYAF